MRRLVLTLVLLGGCRRLASTVDPAAQQALARAESTFARTRIEKDRIDILALRKGVDSLPADSAATLRGQYREIRTRLLAQLAIDSLKLADSVDRRALREMNRALFVDLTEHPEPPGGTVGPRDENCQYDPAQLAESKGDGALAERIYACFGAAARNIAVGKEQLDRLTLLGRLASTPASAERRTLFMAMEPLWRATDGGPVSPYRTLIARRGRTWSPGIRPFDVAARVAGVPADSVAGWLEAALEAWRRSTPDRPVEPWDLYFEMGAAGRALNRRVPRDSLLAINRRFYRELGADPDSLGIRFDIWPRAEKGPVAFTTIGRRAGDGVAPESWVFATYRVGGFDNLAELVHETGHGIHLSGIHTRPAFTDWPDSDTFTEAIADIAGLEIYEPAWQQHYLGDSTDLATSLHAKYFSIMMDMAWALFEIRLEQNPSADPNQVWAEITSHYLHLVPHPELSWWALRGQLIEETGYMLNYALGAFLVADMRAAVARDHGPISTGDVTWYPYMRERIYRFGREKAARAVVADFLGRPPRPEALLADLARIQPR